MPRPGEPERGSAAASGPLVSIVTPSLNQARFIGQTIESVLSQDYPDIEYLVLDGGSTDGALDVIRQYDGRLEWACQKDSGQSNALNHGFRRVGGEIVAWLNSDDILLPGAVSAMVERFTSQPDVGLVYGDGSLIDVDGHTVQELHLGEPNLWDLMHLHGHIVLGGAVFYRAAALEAVGYLDERLPWLFDYDLYLRLCARYPYSHLATPVASVRVYPETLSQSGGLPRLAQNREVLRTYSLVRFPPSTPYYLADLVQLNLAGMQAKNPRSRVRALTTKTLVALCERLKRAVYRRAHRVHDDGWVESPAQFVLRTPRGTAAVLTGEIPWEMDGTQCLRVRIRGARTQAFDLPPGPFAVTIAVPPAPRILWRRGASGSGCTLVRITAARSFVPARRFKESNDSRRLAWRLATFEWAENPGPGF